MSDSKGDWIDDVAGQIAFAREAVGRFRTRRTPEAGQAADEEIEKLRHAIARARGRVDKSRFGRLNEIAGNLGVSVNSLSGALGFIQGFDGDARRKAWQDTDDRLAEVDKDIEHIVAELRDMREQEPSAPLEWVMYMARRSGRWGITLAMIFVAGAWLLWRWDDVCKKPWATRLPGCANHPAPHSNTSANQPVREPVTGTAGRCFDPVDIAVPKDWELCEKLGR